MNITLRPQTLPAMSGAALAKVRRLEALMLTQPQLDVETQHVFHAGCYFRTVCVPAGAALTGVLLRIATTLIVSGHATVYIGGESVELRGYRVIKGSAGRKQAFLAHAATHLTMVFATSATTVEDAENEFTDEADLLLSRKGDHKCQA